MNNHGIPQHGSFTQQPFPDAAFFNQAASIPQGIAMHRGPFYQQGPVVHQGVLVQQGATSQQQVAPPQQVVSSRNMPDGFRPTHREQEYIKDVMFYNDYIAKDVSEKILNIQMPPNINMPRPVQPRLYQRGRLQQLNQTPFAPIPKPVPKTFDERYHCTYCKSVWSQLWHTHTRYNCRTLHNLNPCQICMAVGAENHALNNCPYYVKEY